MMNAQTYLFSIRQMLTVFCGFLLILLTAVTISAANNESFIRPVADFDGDGKSDVSVYRPSDGYWYIMKSSGGFSFVKWGLANDILAPGDYDGDGKTDLAVQRLGNFQTAEYDNCFYILKSSDNSFLAKQWGESTGYTGDGATMPADYDGDGKTDIATYHYSDLATQPSHFTILHSSNNERIIRNWGLSSDEKVPADYDGDGKADLAVFRKFLTNLYRWYILQSSDGKTRVETFGLKTDQLVPADYDGDRKADIAVWRPSDGTWYRINSSDNSFSAIRFGVSTDKPVPADYDGDGKTDVAVFRPETGMWYLWRSSEGFLAVPFGLADDVPIPSVFVR